MSVFHFILTVALFFLLTPGILLRLPSNGSKWTVALVHGVVFAVSMYILCYYVLPYLSRFEGFQEGKTSKTTTKTTATKPIKNSKRTM